MEKQQLEESKKRKAEREADDVEHLFKGSDPNYVPKNSKVGIDDAMLEMTVKNYIRAIAMDHYLPLAQKVISNLRVIAQIRTDMVNFKTEFRSRNQNIEE